MDEYLETIEEKNGKFYYKVGKKQRPVQVKKVSLAYKQGNQVLRKEFTTYRTHHGPVVGQVLKVLEPRHFPPRRGVEQLGDGALAHAPEAMPPPRAELSAPRSAGAG